MGTAGWLFRDAVEYCRPEDPDSAAFEDQEEPDADLEEIKNVIARCGSWAGSLMDYSEDSYVKWQEKEKHRRAFEREYDRREKQKEKRRLDQEEERREQVIARKEEQRRAEEEQRHAFKEAREAREAWGRAFGGAALSLAALGHTEVVGTLIKDFGPAVVIEKLKEQFLGRTVVAQFLGAGLCGDFFVQQRFPNYEVRVMFVDAAGEPFGGCPLSECRFE